MHIVLTTEYATDAPQKIITIKKRYIMKKIFTILALVTMAFALNAQHVARTMNFEGTSRKYMEYIPSSSPDGSMPVIFLLHGLGDNCNNFSQLGFEDVAPNWIIITPEATNATISIMGYTMGVGAAWAAGVGGENITYSGIPIGNIELNAGVNDDGFLLAILDSLENNFNVDTDSVFVAGFSMGGFMSNKMAVKHADRITAIASVSGTLGHFQAFEPTGNINTMHIHGTADETISYDNADFDFNGIPIPVGIGADSLVETWRVYNQCAAEPTVYQYINSKEDELTFEQYTYRNEETGNKTVFIKVNNGIHTWYDGYNNDIDYNREIYNFFIGKAPESFTLTSSAEENGSISPEGETLVNESQYYTFTITPDAGYRVETLTIDGIVLTTTLSGNTYTFQNVTANHSIRATFEEIPTYTISASAGENGTISPAGDTVVYEGTNITFTITPDEGYRIASVIVDAETENETNVTESIVNGRYTFQNVTANHSIRATFEEIPTYTISASAGENGTISPAGDTVVYEGTNITFTITPDEGYRIASVIVDAETENETNVTESIVNGRYTFQNVTANHSIRATFEVIPTYTISASAGENGTISPAGDTVVYEGTNIIFTITPDEGYRVANVIVDAETENETNVTESLVNGRYTFQNVTANHSIRATFEEIPNGIDINAAETFGIYPNPAANVVNITTNGNAELAIFNAIGKEVKRLNTNESITAIDISSLPNGVYFVVVNGRTQKLTVAR